jgi:hypothetical protein
MDSFKEWVNNPNGYSDQEIVSIYNHNPDKKIKEISQITGKSVGEIYRILHNFNVTPNRLKVNHHNVVNFSNFGYNIPEIAAFTGYTERNVRYILDKMVERKNG